MSAHSKLIPRDTKKYKACKLSAKKKLFDNFKFLKETAVFPHNYYFMNKSMYTNIQMFVVCKISYLFI